MTFKYKFGAASLLSLALFTGLAQAESGGSQQQPPVVDQSAQPAAQAVPDEVMALINDKRASSELSEEDLIRRLKAARRAMKMEGLPEDLRGQLQALADADKAELDNRKAAAQPPAPTEQPKANDAADQQQPAQQPAAEQPTQQPDAIPDQVLALMKDKRPSSDLSVEELSQRFKAARKALKIEGLPDKARASLQAMAQADKAELESRNAAAQTQKPAEAPAVTEAPKKAETPPAPAELSPEATQLMADTRPADSLSADELMARMKLARRLAREESLPADARDKFQAMATEARNVLMARDTQAQPQTQPATPAKQPETAPAIIAKPTTEAATTAPPAPEPAQTDKKQTQALDGNAGDPVAEQKAKAFLNDATPAASLNDDALRTKLDAMRDLLAENELSGDTERALRKKLRDEREVLRARLADAKAKEEAKALADAQAKQQAQPQAQQPGVTKPRKKFDFNIVINAETPQQDILRDRRRSEDLAPEELRRRIQTYRDVQGDRRYLDFDPGMRDYWRQTMARDRAILRQRMMEERAMREADLRSRQEDFSIDDMDYAGRRPPQDVFAAEVDDQQIEDVIVAPPRKVFKKRFTVNDIASNSQLRNSVGRIEVDTIHFGFNEAFVREEEVDSLDQVASVMEKVLRKYPREVFLIEGHTDAVGSDAYNIKLSKARAEAVKRTLSTYYLIPAKNLQTVGLGERYLKIPTADPEPENRRVSVSRITSLVGEVP